MNELLPVIIFGAVLTVAGMFFAERERLEQISKRTGGQTHRSEQERRDRRRQAGAAI